MKKLFAATAIVAFAFTTHAGAQTDPAPAAPAASPSMSSDEMFVLTPSMTASLASHLIGTTVYSSDRQDAEAIGDINDLVVADDGSVEAVIIGVGGFLGAGEKNVAVNFDRLNWVSVADADQPTVHLMLATSAAELESAPAFDVAVLEEDPANRMLGTNADMAATQTDPMATTPADGALPADGTTAQTMPAPADGSTMAPADTTTAQTDPMVDPNANPADTTTVQTAPMDGAVSPMPGEYTDVDVTTISANDLINTTVYSGQNDNVGSVGDVILSDDGMIDAVVLDIGGFLGLGQKPVAIAFDALTIRRDANGSLFVFTGFTREQLEGAPDYNADNYLTERDTMRLTAQ